MGRHFLMMICLAAALSPNVAAQEQRQLRLISWPAQPNLIEVRQPNDVTYDMLARSPDRYLNSLIDLKGKVIQVIDNGVDVTLRINVTPTADYKTFTDTVYVDYHRAISGIRILDGDIVAIFGEFAGIKSYQTVLGATMQVPYVKAIVYPKTFGPIGRQ